MENIKDDQIIIENYPNTSLIKLKSPTNKSSLNTYIIDSLHSYLLNTSNQLILTSNNRNFCIGVDSVSICRRNGGFKRRNRAENESKPL